MNLMPKPHAIFGAGLSAQAARRLALAKGLEAVLIDEAGEGDQSTFVAADVARFEAFVFSPGFAEAHPWRVLAEDSGRPCFSEIAFAAQYWEGAIIGITGTNGKTTLTALIHKALSLCGHVSVAAGNIGYPLSDAVLSEANQPSAYAVVEISSFQAELADGLRLDVLLWTNLAEDHLDRYGSMSRYYEAKARLFSCLKSDGVCVIGGQLEDWMADHQKQFDACIVAHEDAARAFPLSADSVFNRFPNSENFLIAAELWWLLEKPPAALIGAADGFSLAPHRLAVVAERAGVRFWNDSKATNFHATLAALESVSCPIIWIGGGRAKGGDVEAFAHAVAGQVEAAILYGEVGDRLATALDGILERVQVHARFEDAVLAAAELAASIPMANVLLSPGFASFDQFDSYAHRGKSFIDTVLSLKSTQELS
jgi:UDP-N-acetylmuramoylalanine--D-glutamate ligase